MTPFVSSFANINLLTRVVVPSLPDKKSSTVLNLFWFSGKGDNEKEKKSKNDSSSDMKEVETVMDSMDNFKRSQKVGKMTDSLVQELSTVLIEGSAAGGKVKVFFDGQQRPANVEIDQSFLVNITADDLSEALTTAMQDAHSKSARKMEEKMKPFFTELGLTP